jgi:hypothetical protein
MDAAHIAQLEALTEAPDTVFTHGDDEQVIPQEQGRAEWRAVLAHVRALDANRRRLHNAATDFARATNKVGDAGFPEAMAELEAAAVGFHF